MTDPAQIEATLIALGVENILKAEPTWGRRQMLEVRDGDKLMREAFDGYFASSKFEPSEALPPFDYDEVLALVTAPQTSEQTDALAAVLPDREMAMELGIEVNRIRAWANQSIPRAPRQSLTGVKLDTPDAESLAQFRTRWQVACDPKVVVRDMLEGCLDPDQVATVALLYPSRYADMRQSCVDAMVAATAKHGANWEPAPDKGSYVQALLQRDPFDAALATAVQAAYQQQDAAKPKPSRPAPKAARFDNADLTPGQKAAAGS